MARKSSASSAATTPDYTSERNISFYEMRAEISDQDSPPPPAIDIPAILEHIESLGFDDNGRYWTDDFDRVICCWPDESVRHPRARLGTIRRTGLPQKELAGTLSSLRLPAGSGLAEQIHLVFFNQAGTNIIGSEFNFHGPRVPGLKHYLGARCRDVCPSLTIKPMFSKKCHRAAGQP